METFTCQSCGAALTAESLDRRLGIITCSHCGAIYDLTRRGGGQETSLEETTAERAPVERAPVELPEHFRIWRRGHDLRIRWRWFTPKAIAGLLFVVVWDGFLVFWYSIAFSTGAPLVMVLFPLLHVAVGVVVTYATLVGLFNRCTVEVSAGMLQVRHRPLPWFPAPKLRTHEIDQLYVERNVNRGKNTTSVTFDVRAVTRDHKGQKIMSGLERLDQALYLEQEIERVLGIEDRPVAGEYRSGQAEI